MLNRVLFFIFNKLIDKRKFFMASAILVMQLCIAFPVYATQPEISINAGYNGKCRLGVVNPVSILLQAGSEDFSGSLILNMGGRKYISQVQLSPNTDKTFSFHIPLWTAADNINVQLYKDEVCCGEKKQSIETIPENAVIAGMLKDSSQPEGYTLTGDKGFLKGRNIYVLTLRPDLNYTLEELKNINFILIDDFRTEDLSDESSKLLRKWIESGNCAFVGSGSCAYKTMTGIFKDIEKPKSVGAGMVIPVKEGLLGISWENLSMLIEKYSTTASISRIMTGNGLRQAIDNSSSLSETADNALKPSFRRIFPIFILLLLYLALITAANIMGKSLQWIFGAAAIIFCCIFFVLSNAAAFGQYRVSSAAVKVYGKYMQEYRLTNVSSKDAATVRLSLPVVSLIDAGSDNEYSLQEKDNGVLLKLGAGEAVHLFSLEEGKKAIEVSSIFLKNDGSVEGTIKNPMAHRLQNCFLIVGDTVIKIGALDGKESIKLNYKLDHNLEGLGDYNYIEAVSKIADADFDIRQLIEYYFNNLGSFDGGAKLVGFCDEKSYIYMNNKKVEAPSKDMNIFDVELEGAEASFYIPPGIIRPAVNVSGDMEAMGRLEYVSPGKRGLELYYALPKDIKVSRIHLHKSSDDENKAFEVYNRSSESWELLKSDVLEGAGLDAYTEEGPLCIRLSEAERVILPQISVYGIKVD